MKEMTCSCGYKVTAPTADEAIEKMMPHVKEKHPEENEKWEKMSPEEKETEMGKLKAMVKDVS